ncbi:CPBP family intramembrane glutamic endopeptidase [Oceanirhabdus sp. W0125-5]|uniref:CPBP family intramembrane glutamic endopeptidase n=1 Tax=Oceanirhabdus sp. W0125-5 TaxID=2999116 RepID=UPI0022F2C089|nr:type II CAAX endopeptidase family protein [Oceanirhabdus sp. W0125-5]WBW97345.1 type II CAAX endopeptidase family protein [Oceanirhabdus sp. W0125-5]
MKNKLLYIQLFLTFIITWGCWITAWCLLKEGIVNTSNPIYLSLFGIGGAFGPGLATWLVLRIAKDKNSYKNYISSLIKWRVNILWYILPFAVYIGVPFLSSLLVNFINVGNPISLKIQPLYMLIMYFPIMIIGGGLEELGWRGFVLPELLKSFSPIISSLILGVIWAIWHLPLFYLLPHTSQYAMNFPFYLCGVIGITFMMTWVYIKTQSTLLSIIYHAAFNSVFSIGFSTLVTDKVTTFNGIVVVVHIVLGIVLLFRTQRHAAVSNHSC